ncbi:MAG: radical SAM protein [Actinomycetota bacterium]|nr:radical SAM protein [Actinomycetota bacterium]
MARREPGGIPEPMAMTAPSSASPSDGGGGRTELAMRQLHFDVGTRPFLVLLELTRSCLLSCRHCRADAMTERHPSELRTHEVEAVLDDLASLGAPRPIVVFTGGDPLCRSDLVRLVRHAARSGLAVAVSPAGTPRASRARLGALRSAGASTVSFSLDGASPSTHDAFRGVDGSFAWTLAGCRAAQAAGLRLQVNTTVSAETVGELPALCRLVAELGANVWSVFFLVPMGRATSLRALSATETEDVLWFLADASATVALKTTEAPHFRRVLLEHQSEQRAGAPRLGPLYAELHRRFELLPGARTETGGGSELHVGELRARGSTGELRARGSAAASANSGASWRSRQARADGSPRRSPLVVGDGRGVVFVSHLGEVCPSGFLPLVAGNVRQAPLSTVYAESPLFEALRGLTLGGRCGRCEYRQICGGSRARAYAASGDPLGEDPSCGYQPGSDTHRQRAMARAGS